MEARHRIEVREVVEVRGRPEERQLQTVDIVAALHEIAAGVAERDVALELESVAHAVRGIEPHGRSLEHVVRTLNTPSLFSHEPDRKNVVRSLPPEALSVCSKRVPVSYASLA